MTGKLPPYGQDPEAVAASVLLALDRLERAVVEYRGAHNGQLPDWVDREVRITLQQAGLL